MNISNAKKIVINYYSEILNRKPDDLGFHHYVNLLSTEKINSLQLQELLKSSSEFLDKNPSNIPNLIFLNDNDLLPELNIVAMYRIKNVERWIKKSLEATSEICSKIVILDDGSTDNTVKICKSFSSVVDIYEQKNLPFDETRDKNLLIQMAMDCKPNYVLILDGDEIIMPGMKKILYEDLILLHPNSNVFEFQSLEMVEQPNKFRINNPTTKYFYKFLFKVKDQKNLHWMPTRFPHNMHCSRIPDNLDGLNSVSRSRVKILHYGYYDKKLRLKKYQFLIELDPGNTEFYGYEHIVHPEKFSIPDDFALLPKGKYIENI